MTASQAAIDHFRDQGYLQVEDLFTSDELTPAMQDIEDIVEGIAERLVETGQLQNEHRDQDLYTRLTAIDRDCTSAGLMPLLESAMGPRLTELWCSPKLLDIVEQLIGPDIAGHPIFALRGKTPETPLMTVPWHQDTAYLIGDSNDTDQPSCWIPFLDASRESGCLQVARGVHRERRVIRHHLENKIGDPRSWYIYIDEEDIPQDRIVTCEMRLGSVLFIDQHTPHRSLENHSDKIRWSIDVRWQNPALPTGIGDDDFKLLMMRRPDQPAFEPDPAAWYAWYTGRGRDERVDYDGLGSRDPYDVNLSGAKWLERWR